jgi:hypothetical protein
MLHSLDRLSLLIRLIFGPKPRASFNGGATYMRVLREAKAAPFSRRPAPGASAGRRRAQS